MKTFEEIQRIIYWWRRYFGIRDTEHGKIFTEEDVEILERRIKKYLEFPFKFEFGHPDMGIDELGYECEGDEE